MRRILLFTVLLCLHRCASAQGAGDTVQVFFPFNVDALTESAQFSLDSLLYKRVLRPTQSLKLIGYGDYVGSEEYNLDLSRRRAMSIQRYLTSSGFRAEKIVLVLGKGRIDRPGMEGPTGYAPDRRVDIVPYDPTDTAPVTVPATAQVPTPVPPEAQGPPTPAAPATTAPARPASPLPSAADFSKVEVNQTFLLDNIYFHLGRHFIKKESLPALDQLVGLLQDNPNVKVRIEGHVCCVGPSLPDALDDDTGELRLSVNRAKYIYDYLVGRGIEPARLSYQGFGHRFPVVPFEHTDEEAQKNRRVEIRIMEK